jgi:hypothetical protein
MSQICSKNLFFYACVHFSDIANFLLSVGYTVISNQLSVIQLVVILLFSRGQQTFWHQGCKILSLLIRHSDFMWSGFRQLLGGLVGLTEIR